MLHCAHWNSSRFTRWKSFMTFTESLAFSMHETIVDMKFASSSSISIIMTTIKRPAHRLIEQQCRLDSLLIWHYSMDKETIPVDLMMTRHLHSIVMFAFYPFHLNLHHSWWPYFLCHQHFHQMLFDCPDLVWILQMAIYIGIAFIVHTFIIIWYCHCSMLCSVIVCAYILWIEKCVR